MMLKVRTSNSALIFLMSMMVDLPMSNSLASTIVVAPLAISNLVSIEWTVLFSSFDAS